MLEKYRHLVGVAAVLMLPAVVVIALSGCASLDSSSSDAETSRTNNYESSTPVYRVDTPTLAELAGTYRSQDRTYHDSMISIFENGEFVWNSRTDTLRIFRGQIYDLGSNGFSVGMNDRSGDALHFQFSPDKRSFFSLDEYGRTVEEYRK